MTARAERTFSRRRFLGYGAALALTPALVACKTPEAPPSPTPTKEKEIGPQEGDVVVTKDSSYLIRNGKKYSIPDLSEYKRLTKFDKYGRKIFTGQFDLDKYPLSKVPQMPLVIDLFTGLPKKDKSFGGEINIYFPGFLTDGGDPWIPLIPKQDAFTSLRKRLEKNKWTDADSLFFTYSKKMFDQYSPWDTMRNPEENIQYALEFFAKLKEDFPLVQFNLIGNSLGGLFALEVARKYPDAINNLILLSSPVRGINKTPIHSNGVGLVKKWLALRYLDDEHVSDYLYDLWDNTDYQKELDQFVVTFTAMGRKIHSFASENDVIVPKESSDLPGVTTKIPSEKGIIGSVVSMADFRREHGRTHEDSGVQEKIADDFGENLAAA